MIPRMPQETRGEASEVEQRRGNRKGYVEGQKERRDDTAGNYNIGPGKKGRS